MMRNTLPPFLQQLLAPVFQLLRNDVNVRGLLDCPGFDSRGIVIAESGVRQLNHGMGCMFIQPFAQLLEHFDGGADLSGGWWLHNQM